MIRKSHIAVRTISDDEHAVYMLAAIELRASHTLKPVVFVDDPPEYKKQITETVKLTILDNVYGKIREEVNALCCALLEDFGTDIPKRTQEAATRLSALLHTAYEQ